MIELALQGALTSLLFMGSPSIGPPPCESIRALEPRLESGRLGRVEHDGVELSRWSASAGETLRLKLHTERPGDYEIGIRGESDDGAFSARLWSTTLTSGGEDRIALQPAESGGLVEIALDPVPMGPGDHVLELECRDAGDILLDCVWLRRTGEMTRLARSAGGGRPSGFLGVQFGEPRDGGVSIDRTIDDTAASRAGIEAGDVVVSFDGVRTETIEVFRRAVRARHAGDLVEIEILRDGVPLTRAAELGVRPRILHVLEVLDVQPGQVIADIGCGTGWLSHAIAEAVGPEGTVYAVELQERHIRALHGNSPANLVPVMSIPTDPFLPAGSLDTAMLHDVASHIARDARPRFYENLTEALKPGGRLVVFGPHGRAQRMLDQLDSYGFVPVDPDALDGLSTEELDAQLHAGIVFRPK